MNEDQRQYLSQHLRRIKDFPKPGIWFRDISSWMADPKSISIMADDLYSQYSDKGITKVVCLEARGFLMGAVLAKMLGAGIVMARKPGRLPVKTKSETYDKEYGTDTIEIHEDAIDENDIVLLHDDLLATGGTMKAACNLVKKFHPKKIYCNFTIELINEGLNGREGFDEDIEITSLIKI